MDILLVDGYNIIGTWPELKSLKDHDLPAARDRLVERMAEYQAYWGYRVIVVFDAQYVQGTEKSLKTIRWKLFLQKRMKQQTSGLKS